MADQLGAFAEVAHAHEADLARRLATSAQLDSSFETLLRGAVEITRQARQRLDSLDAEIRQSAATWPGLDTASGARQFQSYLTGKTREIHAIVADAYTDSQQRAAQARTLAGHYPPGETTGAAVDFTHAPPTDLSFHGITEDQFKSVYKRWNLSSTDGKTYTHLSPEMAEAKARSWTRALNAAMEEAQINTPLRQAAFLAESAEETDWGATLTEYADGSDYQGRLGNTHPGDGMLFKGRGGLQLTGRSNYERAAAALGLPNLVSNPAAAALDPDIAFRTAGWFWRHGNGDLNTFADHGDITEVSRRINGGDHGLTARIQNYREILTMLDAGQ